MNVNALQHKVVASDIPPERLAHNSTLTEKQKIGEASRQFEAILLRQILENTQKTVIKSKLSDDSTAGSVYRDMVTSQLADSMSKSGGFGLAKTFEKQLSGPEARASAADSKSLIPLHQSPVAHRPISDTKHPLLHSAADEGGRTADAEHYRHGAGLLLFHS